MKPYNPFTLNQNSHAISNRLAKFLFIAFFVVVPMIVFWVLWGQFNVLKDNWLIGYGGHFALNQFQEELNLYAPMSQGYTWTEYVNWSNAFSNFFDKYGITNVAKAKEILNNAANAYGMESWGVGIIASWKIFVIMLADLLISILLLQLGIFFTKWFFYDSYPMVIAVWATMFILNVCSLLNYENWWSYIVVIVSLVSTLLVFLICFVQIVNALLSKTKLGEYYYENLLKISKQDDRIAKSNYIKSYEKYKANKKKTITFEGD